MTTTELVGNIHVHTPYSDGALYHAEVAAAAARAGLDFVITTDHNVRVSGVEGYYGREAAERVLLLTGEEVHDTRRDPQANHLLVYGVEEELASLADSPQTLINTANDAGGFAYLAHAVEHTPPYTNEPDLSWVDWTVSGYQGMELWNYMSEFKSLVKNFANGFRYAMQPHKGITGPFPDTLDMWDRMLREGQRVRVIGGADAHGQTFQIGPFKCTLFPYDYLFRCVNTHLVSQHALQGILEHDKRVIYGALKAGHCFVGYDLPASTRGFRFTAQGMQSNAVMGDWIKLGHGVTLQAVTPRIADARLIFNGEVIRREVESTHITHIATEPGAYRVEVYIQFKGKKRGWIFSNPIFVI